MSESKAKLVLFHLHIPKTAGTAVRDAVKRCLNQNSYLEFYPENPRNRDKCISELRENLESKPDVRFISGHFTFGVHEALGHDNYKYFTVLRDPVARFLSHYHH